MSELTPQPAELAIGKGKGGPGRPKGMPNKLNAQVKEMILEALEGLGGAIYLAQKAETHPAAFMALVGKVLPLQVVGNGANGEHEHTVEIKFIAPKRD